MNPRVSFVVGVAAAVAVVGIGASAILVPAPASGGAVVGQPAPSFTLTDTRGERHRLADYAGKRVVLEWWNHECPFVNKHYGSGSMQKLQKEWTGKGVAWLTISSSAPGKQGHVDAARANALMKEKGAAPTAVLLDPDGTVGRAYGARTTPHMFVVDTRGTLVYAGGIDDRPSTDQADLAAATNYVQAALEDLSAGGAVAVPTSEPYGCGVKYAD